MVDTKWVALPHPLPTPRSFHMMEAVGDSLYLCGGQDIKRTYLSSCDRYDIKAERWSSIPPMSSKRWYAASAVGEGEGGRYIYAFGGRDGIQSLSSCERYDSVTGQWSALPPLTTARDDHSAVLHPGSGIIFILGGLDSSDKSLQSVERYDSKEGRWLGAADRQWSVEPLPTPLNGHATLCVGNTLFLLGGWGDKGRIEEVWAADLSAGGGGGEAAKWRRVAAMPTKNYRFGSAVMS